MRVSILRGRGGPGGTRTQGSSLSLVTDVAGKYMISTFPSLSVSSCKTHADICGSERPPGNPPGNPRGTRGWPTSQRGSGGPAAAALAGGRPLRQSPNVGSRGCVRQEAPLLYITNLQTQVRTENFSPEH